jgi:hypothetical protein
LASPAKQLTKENYELLKKRTIHTRTHAEAVLPFEGLTLIYGNTVAYLFPDTNLVTTIKHQGIADSNRAIFDALFRLGKPHSWN